MGTQKNNLKNEEERTCFQGNNELHCVLFKKTSYTAKKKCLRVSKIIYINKTLLVLRRVDQPSAESVVPKFILDTILLAVRGKTLLI